MILLYYFLFGEIKLSFVVIRLKKVLPWFLVLLVAGIFVINLFSVTPAANVKTREIPIYSVERDDNKIALTFDCAWNDDDIDVILDILDNYECKATFFVLGDWAQKYSDSLYKIHQRGHEVGNHSYNHNDYLKLSGEDILSDLDRCDAIVENITGKRPRLVRAPSGGYNDTVIRACKQRGSVYIQWSVDGIDYGKTTPEKIYSRVVQNTGNGDIILLHNGTEHTASILPEILDELSKNYTFATVSDLIYFDGYRIDHTGRQFKE